MQINYRKIVKRQTNNFFFKKVIKVLFFSMQLLIKINF
jgi:hypothetical protein